MSLRVTWLKPLLKKKKGLTSTSIVYIPFEKTVKRTYHTLSDQTHDRPVGQHLEPVQETNDISMNHLHSRGFNYFEGARKTLSSAVILQSKCWGLSDQVILRGSRNAR